MLLNPAELEKKTGDLEKLLNDKAKIFEEEFADTVKMYDDTGRNLCAHDEMKSETDLHKRLSDIFDDLDLKFKYQKSGNAYNDAASDMYAQPTNRIERVTAINLDSNPYNILALNAVAVKSELREIEYVNDLGGEQKDGYHHLSKRLNMGFKTALKKCNSGVVEMCNAVAENIVRLEMGIQSAYENPYITANTVNKLRELEKKMDLISDCFENSCDDYDNFVTVARHVGELAAPSQVLVDRLFMTNESIRQTYNKLLAYSRPIQS